MQSRNAEVSLTLILVVAALLMGGPMIITKTAACVYHAPHGWFSSGADQDGAEYAVLLVAVFTCVTITHLPSRFFSGVANAAERI